ncbi:MAG TPA: glycosyltransferase [Solirubrobacterales bacterium]|jgi:glycosyltransferase involved in cell wall biosynthesis|nr:glycosyltransferase [Solirubrobacterales bacterium]
MANARNHRFALVSREVYPFGGSGIGEYITSCSRALTALGEVTIFTSSLHEESYRQMKAAGDPRMPPPGVQVVFVQEPTDEEVGGYFSLLHLYSARVLEALRDHYGRHGPDLVEFSDYLGEGAITAQARRAGDPMLRNTRVGVRLHTTGEVCAMLDGYLDTEFGGRVTYELERLALRDADAIHWPGGDTYEFYRRFYGSALAPPRRIRNPFGLGEVVSVAEEPRDAATPLRLLYLGRLERRKGVQNLLKAVTSLEGGEPQLTLVGGDTSTAPLGTSMRAQLELIAAGDPRIAFLDAVPRSELTRLIRSHDAVVLPSLWEAWPYVGLEALRLNRPLLTTSAGAFAEMVRPGVNGWRTEKVDADQLTALIGRLLADRDAVDRLRLEGLPAKTFAEFTDTAEILGAYSALLREPARWDAPVAPKRSREKTTPRWGAVEPKRPPLVSIVIPYYRLHEHVEETVASAFAQTHPRLEVIVVNDGSFHDADWALAEVATRYPVTVLTQMNAGLGAARNFGISQSRGRYVVPLDADDTIEPSFVERGVALLESQPDVAYVTSWSRYVDERGFEYEPPGVGYQPLRNDTELVRVTNVAAAATSVIRRRLFDLGFAYSQDLTSFEDWSFYRDLGEHGHEGIVIPERLFRYRIRRESMLRAIGGPKQDRLIAEMDTHLKEGRIRWT